MNLVPTVYESALIEDCIEKGICREEGGAHYNFNTACVVSGPADAGDSLAVIKKLVFEENKATMAELCDALDANFEGFENLHRMCMEVPKYGNDQDYVDEEVKWVMHEFVSEYRQMRNLRGGHGCPGGSPMHQYLPLGKVVGALPSGRLAWEPLADAASPGTGKDLSGPTAVFKSVGKVDNVEILGGVILNMRLDPSIVRNGEVGRLASLIRSFIDQKIYHVQINMVSTETLRAAQKEPEKYRDLMVKVAGYNAFFTQLNREYQDTIIARTAHGF
jgi:formate C-acetyltransferase